MVFVSLSGLWLVLALGLRIAAAAVIPRDTTYEYIVVGSGPGGGPLAANLARAGHSVLLLEAGDDQGENPHQEILNLYSLAISDPLMRWDFFVKHYEDEAETLKYTHLTWRTTNGSYYVGLDPPAGATKLGVYYPRTGTVGGCSAHNAGIAALPSNSDWSYIAELTGDESWRADYMRRYFERLERNHYLEPGSPGHGFDGYLDIIQADYGNLNGTPEIKTMLGTAAATLGYNESDLPELYRRDLNDDDPKRDVTVGMYGFPFHAYKGKRANSETYIAATLKETNADGSQKYPLTVQTTSFVTRVLFSQGDKPKAIGVEYLRGQSMYSADPRFNASVKGELGTVTASKEVIISGGTFNSPQILKLSGIGPKAELETFNIPVVVDLPGVGENLQDNYEMSYIARASKNFTFPTTNCTNTGDANDPCVELYRQGTGPYTQVGMSSTIQYKTSVAALGERDLFMWGSTKPLRGFWPGDFDRYYPPNTYGFSMVKMHPRSRNGTVKLLSGDPRDTPDINFNFFKTEGELDLQAMAEGIDFGREIMSKVPAPLGPFTEFEPCAGNGECGREATEKFIREQAYSHHATSSCSIGADDDPMAVLDSRFRVRGVEGLRVVDASVFPRTPGGFPILPTFMVSEKATDVILEDCDANT